MPIRSQENLIAAWAFLIAVILAVVGGLVTTLIGQNNETANQSLMGLLSILGLVVGYFVAEKDVKTFLFASVSLVIVSFAGIQGGVLSAAILGIVNVNKLITNVLGALMFLFVPATIIVALKTVFSIARS
ncbi:MAG: hypothetical protein A2904_00575 [Candidatus Staskawiczbacteria bacterium RIFCSPLOWO2_01_FULL_33_9]|uniref:MotA/TolQ/ExbB proton channel domain-containing protein n=1 Tax=Candidatus Staskawiczbacteria bacterium RIFCSPLOWO2_01_FULL_33_9 TaxID=1802211 RepID=A0A1G2I6T9_9BACT|nr:MAG: hypothetical protein A2904_00575 [Candidatus Staskawiczbacteria bacterium RIFCSPLOWO2_01_FULL_33_9]